MAFLIGPMQHHIEGHKEITEANEIIKIGTDEVAISLSIGAHIATPTVQVGDRVKIGDLIGKRDDRFYVPIFSSVSGEVVAIEKRMSASLKPSDHVIIKKDDTDEFKDFEKLSLDASKEEIIAYMKTIGLLGQGGAGFPSYIKYATDKCETLIINAVECEPYITADVRNIEEHLDEFKYGVKLMLKASNASKCFVAMKSFHKETIEKLIKLFEDEEKIVVKPVKDVYPMGWERTLTYEVLKKRYDKLPIEAGAIVSNATSAITLGSTALSGRYCYERIVTVSGDNINNPHNVICRIGTPISKLIEACGGVKEDKAIIIMGGPMMGTCVTKDIVTITPISNAVNIFKEQHVKEYACLRCGRCVEHCPSSLMPVSIIEAYKFNDIAELEKLHVNDCVECGMCTFICPSKIEVTESIRRAKKLLAARKR